MKADNEMSKADSEFEFDMDDNDTFFSSVKFFSLRKELKTIIV